jgi:hypothetical protein
MEVQELPEDLHKETKNQRCNTAETLALKIIQHGHSTYTGWSSATKTLGQDTTNSSPLTINIVEKVVLSHRAKMSTSIPWQVLESTEKEQLFM